MLPDPPEEFARQWIEAWNAGEVERVLEHYAEDVSFTSPTAARVVPESAGHIRGKAALHSYWTTALAARPDLHFELLGIYEGMDTLVLNYRDQSGRLVCEVLTFRDGLVASGHATHLDS